MMFAKFCFEQSFLHLSLLHFFFFFSLVATYVYSLRLRLIEFAVDVIVLGPLEEFPDKK